jgi:hypothetical protein
MPTAVATVKRPEGRAPKTTETDDFDYAPLPVRHSFSGGGSQRGGLGKAHQLFGEQLPKLLACPAIAAERRRNELNQALAA